jgi:integrase
MPKLHLTQTAIEQIAPPPKHENGAPRQVIYFDIDLPRFGVRVTSGGAKTFVVQAWHAGRAPRVTLGRVSDLSVSEARRRARVMLGRIAGGANPNDERRADRARSVALKEAFEAYIATKKSAKKLGARTEYDYRRILYGTKRADGERNLNGYLSEWISTPIAEITEAMVARKHADLARRSGAQANYAMRLLRAVANFARAKYKVKGEAPIVVNPVAILSDTHAWVRVSRRRTVIKIHQLVPWFKAVRELESTAANGLAAVVRVYLQFLVLYGLRRSEAARLKWPDVDIDGRTFTLRDTKNREDHMLPLTDYALALLRELPRVNEYVFPGPGKAGYLIEPKKQVSKVKAASGVLFTLHDLRRTFITVAESLDIPAYALKRLLNHKMTSDVTAGYIITDVERLRAPMEKIHDFMLKAAEMRASAPVVQLETSAGARALLAHPAANTRSLSPS